jgi:hypothetical protein
MAPIESQDSKSKWTRWLQRMPGGTRTQPCPCRGVAQIRSTQCGRLASTEAADQTGKIFLKMVAARTTVEQVT